MGKMLKLRKVTSEYLKNRKSFRYLSVAFYFKFSGVISDKILTQSHFDLKKSFNSKGILSQVESRTHPSRPRPGLEKKPRGQGPTFREQTLSGPRTGMVVAKAKNQRHKSFKL